MQTPAKHSAASNNVAPSASTQQVRLRRAPKLPRSGGDRDGRVLVELVLRMMTAPSGREVCATPFAWPRRFAASTHSDQLARGTTWLSSPVTRSPLESSLTPGSRTPCEDYAPRRKPPASRQAVSLRGSHGAAP